MCEFNQQLFQAGVQSKEGAHSRERGLIYAVFSGEQTFKGLLIPGQAIKGELLKLIQYV